MTSPQGALLVGSINLPDAESAFRAAGTALGTRLRRIPDGEPGERFHWISFQPDRIAKTPGIRREGSEPIVIARGLDLRKVGLEDGVDTEALELAPLGYADSALESYAVFRRLREAGEILPGVRFQVSLPTAAAVTGAFVVTSDQARFEPVYQRALERELTVILDAIPHDDLAIQWDVAVEFMLIEAVTYDNEFGGQATAWFGDVWTGVIDRAVHQAELIPDDVELGFHLCYGDAGEEHFVQPKDAGNLTTFINKLTARAPRQISWFHLPVPIERDDDAYFAPLAELELQDGTELYLGLVHREDGPEGATRRIAAAEKYVSQFGVGTECGMGRAPDSQVISLLETHREVSSAW